MNEEYDVIVLGTGLTVSCGGRRAGSQVPPASAGPGPGGEGGSDRYTLSPPAPELRVSAPPWGRSPLARVGSGEGGRGLLGCSDLKTS